MSLELLNGMNTFRAELAVHVLFMINQMPRLLLISAHNNYGAATIRELRLYNI